MGVERFCGIYTSLFLSCMCWEWEDLVSERTIGSYTQREKEKKLPMLERQRASVSYNDPTDPSCCLRTHVHACVSVCHTSPHRKLMRCECGARQEEWRRGRSVRVCSRGGGGGGGVPTTIWVTKRGRERERWEEKRGEGESGNLRENESSGQGEQKKKDGVWWEQSVSKGEIKEMIQKAKEGARNRWQIQKKIRWRKTIFGGKKKKSRAMSARITDRNKVRGENELNLRRESEDLEECKLWREKERKR